MKKLYFGIVALLALVLTACPGGAAVNVAGTWNGRATSQTNPSAFIYIQYVLTDTNGTLGGTYNECNGPGTGCSGGIPVTGTRNGNNANFTVGSGGATFSVTGTFNGNAFTGTGSYVGTPVNVTLNR